MGHWLDLIYGLGIFLYGMNRIERGLEQAGQNRVRTWLSTYTQNPISAMVAGVLITAMLQSSTLVTLLMMALVGANVVPMRNAIGVVLGANLGTTFTGWLVTVIGFKLNLAELALPLLGVGALLFVFSDTKPLLRANGRLIFGAGCLLFGLELMKDSVTDLPEVINFAALSGLPSVVFLLAGIALTAVIQSSSATMMITLTLLDAGLIALPEAAAFIIGADLGTTSTPVLGALQGQATRKRLALAHVAFNVIVNAFAFLLVLPLLPWFMELWPDLDPLYGLVLFHSSFNFVGLMLFVPFMRPFERWLQRFFATTDNLVTRFIHDVPTNDPNIALQALRKESHHLLVQTLRFIRATFSGRSNVENYQQLKTLEGEILQYASKINDAQRVPLLNAGRELIIAARTANSIKQDWLEFRHNYRDFGLSDWQRRYQRNLAKLRRYCQLNADGYEAECLNRWRNEEQLHGYDQMLTIHALARETDVEEILLSTLLNLNHELLSIFEHLTTAVEELTRTQADAP